MRQTKADGIVSLTVQLLGCFSPSTRSALELLLLHIHVGYTTKLTYNSNLYNIFCPY